MLKKLLIGVGLFLAALVLIGMRLPDKAIVERSISIERPSPLVFTLLNGFTHFEQWSPLKVRDPQAELLISGPTNGPGARISWQGDPRQVGDGFLEITGNRPFDQIDMLLDLGGQGRGTSFFLVRAHGNSTVVTWGIRMDSRHSGGIASGLLRRYFGLLLNPWLGSELEDALGRFRALAESMPAVDFSGSEIELIDVNAFDILFVPLQTVQAASDVSGALADAFAEMSVFLRGHQLEMAGQPMAISRIRDEQGYRLDAAIPVTGTLPPLTGRLQSGHSPSGRVIRMVHRGPYADIPQSYRRVNAYMAANGLEASGVSWEQYVTDPAITMPEASVTLIFVQLAD